MDQILPREEHYLYTQQKTFHKEGDPVRGFIMKNYTIGMHAQDFFEINIITRGEGIHFIGERRMPARVGDVFILPPRIPHGYDGGRGFDVGHLLMNHTFMDHHWLLLQTMPSFLLLFRTEPLLRGSTEGSFHLTLTGEPLVRAMRLMDQLSRFRHSPPGVPSVQSEALTLLLIALLCETYEANPRPASLENESCDESFLRALTRMHEEYAQKLTIDELAQTAHLSRSAFLRKFQEVCHTTPARYLTRRRLEAVQHLLLETGLSLSEIAERTGFCDASHLTRIFRIAEGCTPSEFRKGKIQ